MVTLITTSTNAALVDNGGGLIYDNVLDITWAQPDTPRTWEDAKIWASGLRLGGVSGWRLPYISVAAGAGPITGPTVECDTATELACRDNELGYMFYHNLSGTFSVPILLSGDPDLALFPSLQSADYWSGTEHSSFHAWEFFFGGGYQLYGPTDDNWHSWAVHAGNVAPIPIPGAAWLLGSGLIGLVGITRTKNRV
jgi:hypothetical protein